MTHGEDQKATGHGSDFPDTPPADGRAASDPRDFWGDEREIDAIDIRIEPPEKPLAILEKLGPSPFERGGFPLIGFFATAYDKVSRYALERGSPHGGAAPREHCG